MPEGFDQDALAKLSGNVAQDSSLPIKPHPKKPMDPAEVSPRAAARIRDQENMERAISNAQEANCGLNGSLKCHEAVEDAVRAQGLPRQGSARTR